MIEIGYLELLQVKQQLGAFQSRAPHVIANALNKAGNIAKKRLPEVVRNLYDIEGAPGGKTPEKAPRLRRAGPSNLQSILRIKTGTSGLDHFRHYYGADVSASVRKGEMKVVEGAFAATVNGLSASHHGMIWKRVPGAVHVKNKKNVWSQLPIHRLYSVPVASMFKHDDVIAEFDRLTMEAYEAILPKIIASTIKRGKAGKL